MSDMKNLNFDGRLDEVLREHKDLHEKVWKLQRGEIGILEVLQVINRIRDDELALIDIISEYETNGNKTANVIEIPAWVNRG